MVSLFAPESNYTSRAAELARQKKLADMLIEMSQQEMPVSTAGGITAPVSPYGALAKALTSFGGSYLSGKAAEDEAALKRKAREEAFAARSAIYEKPGETATLPGQEFNLKGVQPDYTPNVNSEFPEAPPKQNPLIAALKMGDINYNLPATPRSYEEQQRMLDEYEMSDNPYIAQLAATQRPRIEAERERTMPKYMAVGAGGVVDVNKNSPNYGSIFGAPAPKAPDLPASVDEYNFAQTPAGGSFKGSYTDWLKTKTGATTRISVENPRQVFAMRANLRKEFNSLPDVKAFNDAASSYDVISDLAKRKNPTPQDDLSLIYSYVKMLDPNSVVREGEFANAQNAASVPDRIRNAYNKAVSGNGLNSDQRKQYSEAAKGIYESRSRRYNSLVDEYSGYAEDMGFNPKDVITPRGIAGTPAPSAPASVGASGPRLTPEQAAKLPPNTPFIGMDGIPRRTHE